MKKASVPTTKRSDKRTGSVENVENVVQQQQLSEMNRGETYNTVAPVDILPDFLPDLAVVNVTDTAVFCSFEDGRTVSFPLQWSDKLAVATASQRQDFDFNAHYIFWHEIDEIIGVRNILLGKRLHW